MLALVRCTASFHRNKTNPETSRPVTHRILRLAPLKGNVVRRTEKLIEQYNPDWRGGNLTGIHPGLFRDLGENGFEEIESFTFDEPAIYTHESWRGRIRASAGIAATLTSEEVERFDAELAALLAKDFPEEPMAIPHRVFVVQALPAS